MDRNFFDLTGPTGTAAYWSRSTSDVLAALHTRRQDLSGDEAAARLGEVGHNMAAALSRVVPPLIWILIFAALASLSGCP